MDMNHQVVIMDVQQEVRLTQDEIDALDYARFMVKNSVTLKDKEVLGMFLCFDSRVPDNERIVIIDESDHYVGISMADVVTITNTGAVIGERAGAFQ